MAAALLATGGRASADDFLDRVNAVFANVPTEKRSDLVVLPAAGKLDAPPAGLRSAEQAARLADQGPEWEAWEAWAQKEPQQKTLAAIAKVTEQAEFREAYAFALPYGASGAAEAPELIQLDLYAELGDPPSLGAAKLLYMPALERIGVLVHVEASRLSAAGNPDGAIKVLVDWLWFSRQVADRQFRAEKDWALRSMILGLERIRDVAYLDFRAEQRKLTAEQLKKHIERLKDRRGVLGPERLTLPEGDLIGKEQLITKVMIPGGGASPSFGAEMAKVTSVDRPLRLFAGAAYWDTVAAGHAPYRETQNKLEGLRSDWKRRWDLSPFDKLLETRTDFELTVAKNPRYAVLGAELGRIEDLFELRRSLRLEAAGTRMSLAVYATFLFNKALPRSLAATRPAWVPVVDADPWSRQGAELQFFVPLRDTPKTADGDPRPHTINIYPPEPFQPFALPMRDDQFVIYSVGPDNARQMATDATQERTGVPGDFLLWPPVLSLVRQRLIELGELN